MPVRRSHLAAPPSSPAFAELAEKAAELRKRIGMPEYATKVEPRVQQENAAQLATVEQEIALLRESLDMLKQL